MLVCLTRAYRKGERVLVNLGAVTYAEPCSVTYGAGDSIRVQGSRLYFMNGERLEVTCDLDSLGHAPSPAVHLQEQGLSTTDRQHLV